MTFPEPEKRLKSQTHKARYEYRRGYGLTIIGSECG